MNAEFSRTLALLRQEKKVSQRTAAEALGISQALMSHYEKGVREPGLSFVVNACTYYDVSADFLLGRTLDRKGSAIVAEELSEPEVSNTAKGSILATLNKKLLLNSVGMIFDLYSATNNRDLITYVSNYFAGTVSVLFRRLHNSSPDTNSSFFAVSQPHFMAGAYDMEKKASEVQLVEALSTHKKARGEWHDLNHDILTQQYGPVYQSLLQNLYGTGERTNKMLGTAPKKPKKK